MPALLIAFSGFRDFISTLDAKWLNDLQDFIHAVLPKLVVIAIGAWLLMRLLALVTKHMVGIAERHGAGSLKVAQTRTVASVLRATGIGVIVFLAALMILQLFNFNLGPLLASAGVVGVALGLAAQTIVKDCLNGILILIEDQYNVGDVVRIAGLSGTVETMSLRKTQVRDGDGTLYIVPNSQITTVANLTRDYSLATINIAVDFSADPDKVMAILKEAALSVRNDPAYSSVYLDTPDKNPSLLGVDAIKGSQVIYPVQLKTLANKQWAPMRETQRRIRKALEENGILPGDSYRVFNYRTGSLEPGAPGAATHEVERPDPTAAKAHETSPFTGETN